MKRWFLRLSLASLALSLLTGTASATNAAMKCESGPILKTFGKTAWQVYGCADGKSIVVMSAEGNPALPFYFMFYPKNGAYQLVGEGSGKKEYTAAAYQELEKLTDADILKLHQQTKTIKK